MTEDELAHWIADTISRDLAHRLVEPRDAASAEVMRQDACEAAHTALTRLGARAVEFHRAADDAIRVSFLLPPQHWDMVLGVEFSDDDE